MSAPAHLEVMTSIDERRIRQLLEVDRYFWLDLVRPGDEDLARLGDLFGFHELALEDSSHFGQRPKIDEYGDHTVLVYFGADRERAVGHAALVEVHVFIHGSFVVTVRRHESMAIDALHGTFERVPMGSEEHVLYRILDTLTDTLTLLVDRIEHDIETLEQDVVRDPQPEHSTQVMALKGELARLARTVGPQREVSRAMVQRLADVPGLDRSAHDYFRDVHDHMIRVEQAVATSRMLVGDVLSVYMAATAQRQNAATERLNVIATIFLPLSFVVGFFGQNFGWMVRAVNSRDDFLVWGIGSLAVSLLLLAPLLRRAIPSGRRPRRG
ncbi:MAG: magnesium and cobalt transport protein CorA [Thermoleophilia bacterium]|nr:magnesium and cobalt transport protein CorA [Thermoleophilia bacterium]